MGGTPLDAGEGTGGDSGPGAPPQFGWNWGAFLLSLPWLLAHRMPLYASALLAVGIAADYVALSGLAGIASLAVGIYLGVHGDRLAWQRRRFRGAEHFYEVQRAWMRWGVGTAAAVLPVLLFHLWLGICGDGP
jgi:hypothetical protein